MAPVYSVRSGSNVTNPARGSVFSRVFNLDIFTLRPVWRGWSSIKSTDIFQLGSNTNFTKIEFT